MKLAVEELEAKAKAAKAASRKLAHLPTEVKNKALINIAESLVEREGEILDANRRDCEDAKASGMGDAMLDRLMLNSSRLQAMAQDLPRRPRRRGLRCPRFAQRPSHREVAGPIGGYRRHLREPA